MDDKNSRFFETLSKNGRRKTTGLLQINKVVSGKYRISIGEYRRQASVGLISHKCAN